MAGSGGEMEVRFESRSNFFFFFAFVKKFAFLET